MRRLCRKKIKGLSRYSKEKIVLEETPPERKMQKEELAKMYMCQICFPILPQGVIKKIIFTYWSCPAIMKAKKLNTAFVQNISTFIIFNELIKFKK